MQASGKRPAPGTSTTASLYWQIALANERIALGEQSLVYARRTQSLVEVHEVEQTVTALSAVAAERLYEVRYRAGAVALRAWLDAQERHRAADLALSANQLARLQNQSTLYQALGGGFEP